jgi:hypothetical protein
LRPVLATFARAMPRAFPEVTAAEGTVVTLTVTGEAGGQWSVRQEKGCWTLYERTTAQPDAEVVLDEENAWRLFTRGISQGQAPQHATLVGNRALSMRLLEMVSIIA